MGCRMSAVLLESNLLFGFLLNSYAGFVAGTVKERPNGAPEGSEVPVWRRVRLYDERSGNCLRETWSDATTGAYRFDYIDMERVYTVLSYDHNGKFVAEAASGLVPERMQS